MEKLHQLGLLFLNFTFLNILLSLALMPLAIAGRKFFSSPHTRSRLFFMSLAAPPFLSAFTVLSSFAPPFFVKIPGKGMFCLNEPYCYIFSFISPDGIPFFVGFLMAAAALVLMPLYYMAIHLRSYIHSQRGMMKLTVPPSFLKEVSGETGFLAELKRFEDRYLIKVRTIDIPLRVSLMTGYLSNTLILSKEVLETLSLDELRCLLAHELSHSRRWDNLLKEILFACRNSLIMLPHVHYLFRWWKEEIELIGDEAAAMHTGRPLDVASAILKTMAPLNSGITGDLSHHGAGFNMSQDDHLLSNRIERLVALCEDKIKPIHGGQYLFPSEKYLLGGMTTIFLISFITITGLNPLLIHCYLEKLLYFYS